MINNGFPFPLTVNHNVHDQTLKAHSLVQFEKICLISFLLAVDDLIQVTTADIYHSSNRSIDVNRCVFLAN
jgi:hypothetical protein